MAEKEAIDQWEKTKTQLESRKILRRYTLCLKRCSVIQDMILNYVHRAEKPLVASPQENSDMIMTK